MGGAAPDFKLPLYGSGDLSLADLRGSVVVVNFWASWCGPCRYEAPTLEQLWQEYRGQSVRFMGVDIQDTPEGAQRFIDEFHITYPNGPDQNNVIGRAYRITGVPETYLIGKDGRLAKQFIGPVEKAGFESAVNDLIKGRSGDMKPTKEPPQPSVDHAGGERRPAWRNVLILLPVAIVVMVGIGAYAFLAHPGQRQSQTLTAPAALAPELKLIPVSALSDKVRAAPDVVRDAYRFAAANPTSCRKSRAIVSCGAEGHQSHLACYVKQVNADDGSVVFDDHALNCGICVDI